MCPCDLICEDGIGLFFQCNWRDVDIVGIDTWVGNCKVEALLSLDSLVETETVIIDRTSDDIDCGRERRQILSDWSQIDIVVNLEFSIIIDWLNDRILCQCV